MTSRNFVIASVFSATLALLVGCQPSEQTLPMPAQAPLVSVAEVVSSEVSDWQSFTGRLQAAQTVELRPRVSGYIDLVTYREGSLVKAGDPLFLIDNRQYRAEVKRLEAELELAQSELKLAEKTLARANNLIGRKAISKQTLDDNQATHQQSQARIAAVKAQLAQARLDLGHTRVVAPIDGKVSRAYVTQGNYVSAGDSLLTSIVSVNEIHAYFDADEKTYLEYVKQSASNSAKSEQKIPVVMGLATDKDFPYQGYIDFIDNQVDQTTGTIRGRAVFDNKQGMLLPGLFARLQILNGNSYQGILIDEKAIGTDLNNKYVLVVDGHNQLQYRAVELGANINGLRIVKTGLNAGETIVVNGLQRVRPGMQVSPNPTSMLNAAQEVSLQKLQNRVAESQPKVLAHHISPADTVNATVGG